MLLNRLAKVEDLLARRQWPEAEQELSKLAQRFSSSPDVFRLQSTLAAECQDAPALLAAAQRWAELAPNDPEAILNLAGACLSNVYPVNALQIFGRFVQRWPDHSRAAEARELVHEMEENVQEILEDLGLSSLPDAEQVAIWHEQLQAALAQTQYKQALDLADRISARAPNFAAPHNNVSLVHFAQGKLDEAIAVARRVLQEIEPNNLHAQANLIHFLCSAGRLQEARQLADSLKANPSRRADAPTKKAYALSMLGDDACVLEIFDQARQAEKHGEFVERDAMLYHLAAAAAARLGQEKEAVRYWKKALEIQPNLNVARENLADMKKPVGQRHAPWAFDLNEWLPRKIVVDVANNMSQALRKGASEQRLEKTVRRLIEKYPTLPQIIPLLLERGGPQGRDMAYHLAQTFITPEILEDLAAFVRSPHGPDQLRSQVAMLLTQKGYWPPGSSVPMWVAGNQTEVLLMGFEISGEPKTKLKSRTQQFMAQAVAALYDDDAAAARSLLQEALKIEPDHPSLLMNLANTYMMEGDREQAVALIRRAVEIDPDYIIGRCEMARQAIKDGKLDEAEEWLKPVFTAPSFHFSEFVVLCKAQIELGLAQGRKEAAHSWFGMWEQIEPEHPHLPAYRRLIGLRRRG